MIAAGFGYYFKLRRPQICRIQQRLMHIKRSELYEKCYRILGVDDSTDQTTVRNAYLELVKKVHPDSGQPESSAERFQEVDEAFKLLLEKFAKRRRGIYEDEEEKVFDIRHTAPQHRQYLNFDGVGVGNPFQRQKQYQQVKAMKAQERVLDHRLEKSRAGEATVMKKGTFFKKHAIKTKYGFDRVVEDLIQEAMSKGDFNNLAGTGKPLTSTPTQNPYLDFTTHKLNKILLDNGFTPEWIMLQRDIRDAVKSLKSSLAMERAFYSDFPFDDARETAAWQQFITRFDGDVQQINKSIDKYNLIVPILQNQLFRLKLQTIAQEILQDPSLPKNMKRQMSFDAAVSKSEANHQSKSDLFSLFGSLF